MINYENVMELYVYAFVRWEDGPKPSMPGGHVVQLETRVKGKRMTFVSTPYADKMEANALAAELNAKNLVP